MSGTALILGASGRFGRHVTQRFRREGWTVRVLRRQGVARAGEVVADIFDEAQMIAAAEGVDVIVNALNPKYSDWPDWTLYETFLAVAQTGSLSAAARQLGWRLRPGTSASPRRGRTRT
ncbi:MAG: NAD-dependent epimerase/dehydratase family protein [Pseudomonadota bacterium]